MLTIYLILYILAGVFFGLAAGRVTHKVDYLALGLFCFAAVEVIQTAQKL